MPRAKYNFHVVFKDLEGHWGIFRSRRGAKVRGVSNSHPTLAHAKKSLREILRSEISASKTQIDNVSKIRLDNIEDWSK